MKTVEQLELAAMGSTQTVAAKLTNWLVSPDLVLGIKPAGWIQTRDRTNPLSHSFGSDRMDLCLRYGDVTLAMELKVWREGRPDPLPAGLEQLDRYLTGLGLDSGWLVIFDQRPGLPPIAERTTTERAETASGRQVTVIRG